MGKAINDNYMPEFLKMCHSNPLMAINYDFYEWALNLMLVKNWHLPITRMDALELFGNLLNEKSNYS